MRIRLNGTTDECAAVVTVLRKVEDLDVLEVSDAYPNRGASQLVRVYLEVAVGEPGREANR